MAENQYDLMIVGTGPAGTTAALYGQRLGLRVIVFGDVPGGSTYMIENLSNYPGFTDGISGAQFGIQAFQQAQQEGATFTMTRLERLSCAGKMFVAVDAADHEFTAPGAVVASGRVPLRLAVPNANLKGIHFCSICDGPLYRNSQAKLVVIGSDNAAGQHALTLSRIAQKVYLIHRSKRAYMDAVLLKRIQAADNIEVLPETDVTGFQGLDIIEEIDAKGPDARDLRLAVDGVFLAIGWSPNTSMLDLPVETSADGYLTTDENLMTSCTGLFAAGDVRKTDMWQVLTACADGARAARHAAEFLE